MNRRQRKQLAQRERKRRGTAIIDETQEQFRQDGYSNLLNKYGTNQDNSIAYEYSSEVFVDDMQLTQIYESNGLFAKIIDRPAEEAVKHGLDIDYGDQSIMEYVEAYMDELALEDKFATAEKWARLYGGAIIVMLVDDGGGLEEPLDWQSAKGIEDLLVFERSVVQPGYMSMYRSYNTSSRQQKYRIGEPEYYQVYSIYGQFKVHHSRCLLFRNGKLPEQTSNENYRNWGIPEYVKIKRALRECITSHENGTKLLERCVQAIYKMKNLANLLSTENGEDKVLQRLQIIDMARSLLNSIAIDNDGEEYTFESFAMSGVKEILDSTCNMLSAVTNIPQTLLFGRSPAGMNSTGENDLENYYNMVENIQKQNMKANVRIIIDLILQQGKQEGKISGIPKYKVKFAPLWSLSETEQATIEKTEADTEYAKAQTMQVYMDNSVLDPSEVRDLLIREGKFGIEEENTENDLTLPEDTFHIGNAFSSGGIHSDVIHISGTDQEADADYKTIPILEEQEIKKAEPLAAAVLVIKDGKILCAFRDNHEGICGPGGKIEKGETTEAAAIREAQEEFHVTPINLLPLGDYRDTKGLYLPAKLYFTDQYSGSPKADGEEMHNARWMTLQELSKEYLFPPFEESIKMLLKLLEGTNIDRRMVADGGEGSGNFGHEGRPGQIGGSGKGGSQKVGEVDTAYMDAAIQYFGDQIRNRTVENMIVIDKEGNVYQAVGEEDRVELENVNFEGAVITHNHPESQGIVSFGEDDFYFLREYQELREFHCVNKEYTYTISVLKDISEVVYNDIYKEGFKYNLETDFEANDAAMRILQERGYISYDKRRVESEVEGKV